MGHLGFVENCYFEDSLFLGYNFNALAVVLKAMCYLEDASSEARNEGNQVVLGCVVVTDRPY